MGFHQELRILFFCDISVDEASVLQSLEKLADTYGRSGRRIRDQAMACKPEVVTCEWGNRGQTRIRIMVAARLGVRDFLFDVLYIRVSISHRYQVFQSRPKVGQSSQLLPV